MEAINNMMEVKANLYSAYWTSLNSGVVSFQTDWVSLKMPELFWGSEERRALVLKRAPLMDYADLSGYYVEGDSIIFVARANRYWKLAIAKKKRLYLSGTFNGWVDAIGNSAWEMKLEKLGGEYYFKLEVPKSTIFGDGELLFKFVTEAGEWLAIPPDVPNVVCDEKGIRNYIIRKERTGMHRFYFESPMPLSHSHDARLVFRDGEYEEAIALQPGVFLKELKTEAQLGVEYHNGMTWFRIFAPRASGISLYLFQNLDTCSKHPIVMRTLDGMVWEVGIPGRRDGWYYYYNIKGELTDGLSHFDGNFPVLDPYAKACVGPLGPGIVVAEERLVKKAVRFSPPSWHDLVISEVHVRDLLAVAPIELTDGERMGFAGLSKWIRSEDFYLKRLGVNAVELQPIHEFDTVNREEYGWGYMPVNYFSPASQYGTDPANGTQIEEFIEVVEAFHEAGMAVIIDVVYNHVGNPNYLQYIDKQYYFMLNEDGHYINHSGCGNTIDPDTPMTRRLMADSLIHLLEVYDVDGFRFDLGELIGQETLEYLHGRVKAVKPAAFFVVEPWSFRGHIAKELKESSIASWNDGYREFMRDYLKGEGSAEGLSYFMRGCRGELTRFPAQTVNYVCSHDDRVWIDKVTENVGYNGNLPTTNDRRRTHLMIGTLMMSVGIPMLHQGLDFLFSKHGVNNSYLDGELNALRYDRMLYYSGTHEYFRKWVAFRQSHLGRLVRLDGHPERGYFGWSEAGRAGLILFNARGERGHEQLIFAINPEFTVRELDLPAMERGEMVQLADHERFEEGGLRRPWFHIRDKTVELPPMSCGLWVNRIS